MSGPNVSVIIPTYNRAQLLPRALDSVVAQSYCDWEIILVDDGSTDDTDAIIHGYTERLGDRFVSIKQENRGSSAARNRGIDAARGRFIAFLDSDDEFLPTKLQRQLALFQRCPSLGFVYSDYAIIDLSGKRQESVFDGKFPRARAVASREVSPGLYVCEGSLFDDLIGGYFIATIVGMVRREVLGSTVRFDPRIAYAEEWLFYLQVAKRCAAGFVDEPLSLHHFVPDSLARSDKHRNTLRFRQVLRAIEESFNDLTYRQRATLDRQLARVCLQLGYDANGLGDLRGSLSYFVEGFGRRPSVSSLIRAATAAGRSWRASAGGAVTSSPSNASQELSALVR